MYFSPTNLKIQNELTEVCVSHVSLQLVLFLSGCIWEPGFSRLHTIWICGPAGKQESTFSQMVSQLWNVGSRQDITATAGCDILAPQLDISRTNRTLINVFNIYFIS